MEHHVRRLTFRERIRRLFGRKDHMDDVVRGLPLQDLHAPESSHAERLRKTRS